MSDMPKDVERIAYQSPERLRAMSDEQLPGGCIECGHPCFPELLAKRLVKAEADLQALRNKNAMTEQNFTDYVECSSDEADRLKAEVERLQEEVQDAAAFVPDKVKQLVSELWEVVYVHCECDREGGMCACGFDKMRDRVMEVLGDE